MTFQRIVAFGSREVRRVPKDWKHPQDARGRDIPLFSDDPKRLQAEWDHGAKRWASADAPPEAQKYSYEEWDGPRPKTEHYMPVWSAEEATHYQMYETTSEGTPLSPVMETPEQLAQWLVDHRISVFGKQLLDYEGWLAICRGKPSECELEMNHED